MRVQFDENASKTARMVEKRPGQRAIDLHEGAGRMAHLGALGLLLRAPLATALALAEEEVGRR